MSRRINNDQIFVILFIFVLCQEILAIEGNATFFDVRRGRFEGWGGSNMIDVLIRNLAMAFDAYLPDQQAGDGGPKFSRTV